MEWNKESWFSEVTKFRRNPQVFLSTNRIDEETFALDILQALCLETVHIQTKIQLLGLIQEYGTLLCPTPTSVEQVVASLQDIYQQTPPEGATNMCYMGQILTTITNLLISSNQLVNGPLLLINFVNVLLNAVCKVNNGSDRTLRCTACECLTTIEISYPGIFLRKLEHFNEMCQKENTQAFQNYATLFITALRNAVKHVSQETPSVNAVSDMLCNRIEPLKPLTIPPHLQKYEQEQANSGLKECLSEEIETQELKRATSFIMELCPLMTTSSVVNLAMVLADIVEITPDLSPSIFKSLVLKYLPTTDASLLNLLFHLKLKFGSDLFSDVETRELLHRLVLAAINPSTSIAHCLLYLEWTRGFMESKIGDVKGVLLGNQVSALFFPEIFDGVDTYVKKLKLLSLAVRDREGTDSATWNMLMSSLICLHKPVVFGEPGRLAVALFRALFNFYNHHQGTALDGQIQNFVIDLMVGYPKFSPYVLDFIESVLSVNPESSLPLETLSRLVQFIISNSPIQAMGSLHFYLPILERASQETHIKPLPIINFLLKILNESTLCHEGDWRTGSELLAICKSMLAYHNTRSIYRDLGSLLHIMFTKYQDIEIRDRSKFYYALFCNLSSDKVSSILLQGKNEGSVQLSTLVAGTTNFPTAAAVKRLDHLVISLQRIHTKTDGDKLVLPVPLVTMETDLLSLYKTCISSPKFNPGVTLSYHVTLEKDCEFDTLYAVALHIDTPTHYKKMSNVYISSLVHSDYSDQDHRRINLTVCPEEPVPSLVNIRAVFTSGGVTYESQLQPIKIKFSDLFLPLSLPPGVDMSNQQLFDLLWECFTSSGHSDECMQSVWNSSSTQLDNVAVAVETVLQPYIVYSNSQEAVYHVGMMLPPKHHLLLKISNTCVSIATDNWKILPFVSQQLNELLCPE